MMAIISSIGYAGNSGAINVMFTLVTTAYVGMGVLLETHEIKTQWIITSLARQQPNAGIGA
jgi:hypothetical protein